MLLKFDGSVIKYILAFLLIIAVAIGGFFFYDTYIKIVPEELLAETLENSLGADSYKYSLFFKLYVDGQERVLSDIEGERSGRSFHIAGRMLEQDIDVYQIGDLLLIKDFNSDRWMERRGSNLLDNEYFLVELDPLASFQITDVKNLEYLGRKKTAEGKFYLLEFNPTVEHEILNQFWENFKYTIWIDRQTKRIADAEINATHKNDTGDRMVIETALYDYNKRTEIKDPREEEG